MANIRDITGKNRKFTGTDGIKLPIGTTAQRVDEQAQIRFNSNTNLAEYYNGSEWKSIDAPPVITGFTIDDIGGSSATSGSIDGSAGGTSTIEILGSLFDTTGATVTFPGTSETISTQSITRNSANKLTVTVTRSDFDNSNEPYTIKVTNGSGLSAELANVITQNQAPAFGTAADTDLGTAGLTGFTANGGVSAVATDADGDTVTHTISAGSLPTGISLATNGSFTGSFSGSGSGTSTFTVSATDGTATTTRQFTMDFTDSYDVQYLVVAAGGGGGGDNGGAGGAGGYRTATGFAVVGGTQYTITVGTGGSGGRDGAGTNGVNGGNSVFATITSTGGGGGLGQNDSGGPSGRPGGSGAGIGQGSGRTAGSGNSPSVSPSQGNPGAVSNGPGNSRGGGGGGASQSAQNGASASGGAGGNGTASTITGSSITYAGGGGGGADQNGNGGAPAGSGGGGGGGNGNTETGQAPSGSANTGGGGGGGAQGGNAIGGNGGTGVVILRMATAVYSETTTGSPTVTTDGTDTILKFTGSGSYTA